jgi:glycosyltransferase involved in cell wall biosynthesis
MVFYDMQEFGGLEEYAVELAIALQQQGHAVSALSAAWIPADNQYLVRLRQHGVPVAQVPKWLSLPASDWPTKERILTALMWLLAPVVYLLGTGLALARGRAWRASVTSARNWLRGQLMSRAIGPDRRRSLGRLLLHWWRLRWRPDILHIHGYTSNLLFAIDWADAQGVPVAYEEHQTPDGQFDWWQDFRTSINKADVVVAVSETSAKALRTVCGVTQPMIVRGPLLADPRLRGWKRTGTPMQGNGALSVTTVARLGVTKGLMYLLDAIAEVNSIHPGTQFRVYGDGELRPDLLAHAAGLGLDGEAIFVGPFTQRSDLDRIMAQTDIYAMSSILEGQPLAIVEAMAYGCPIVTTSVGGIPELIEDGMNGLLVAPADAKGLAQGLCKLIEDPALRQRLGQAARQSYERSAFQPASVGQQFEKIYRAAISGQFDNVAEQGLAVTYND